MGIGAMRNHRGYICPTTTVVFVLSLLLLGFAAAQQPGFRAAGVPVVGDRAVDRPGDIDPALGPWQVERMLFPYPATIDPDRGPRPPRRRVRAGSRTARLAPVGLPIDVQLAIGIKSTVRKLLGVLSDAGHAVGRGFDDPVPPPVEAQGPTDQEADAVRTRLKDFRSRLDRLLETLQAVEQAEPESEPDGGVTGGEPRVSASDPFALQMVFGFDDVVRPADPWALAESRARAPAPQPDRRSSSVTGILLQSSGVAFMAALVLVPFGCSRAAGAMYGCPRDGPHASRGGTGSLGGAEVGSPRPDRSGLNARSRRRRASAAAESVRAETSHNAAATFTDAPFNSSTT